MRNQDEFLTDADFPLEAESIEPDSYPLCRKCGASHKMGVKTMATGHIEPMDICYDCLWIGDCKSLTEQVILNEK